jgi:hypothetical protein
MSAFDVGTMKRVEIRMFRKATAAPSRLFAVTNFWAVGSSVDLNVCRDRNSTGSRRPDVVSSGSRRMCKGRGGTEGLREIYA